MTNAHGRLFDISRYLKITMDWLIDWSLADDQIIILGQSADDQIILLG